MLSLHLVPDMGKLSTANCVVLVQGLPNINLCAHREQARDIVHEHISAIGSQVYVNS